MKTEKVVLSESTLEAANISSGYNRIVSSRNLNADDWIELHASGTLRKNKRIGFAWVSQYRTERVAWEFGYHFESLPESRVTIGRPITAGDCRASTETGWFAERLINRNPFEEDIYEVAYINATGGSGKGNNDEVREGVGIILKQTSAQWIPNGHLVFAFVSTFNKETNSWTPPINPC